MKGDRDRNTFSWGRQDSVSVDALCTGGVVGAGDAFVMGRH